MRVTTEQVDRLIDRALRGEPIPRGLLMMALLCCEVQADAARALRERLPDPQGVRVAA